MFKISKLVQTNLFRDDPSLTVNSVLKTHKNFADCKYDLGKSGTKLFLGLLTRLKDDDFKFKTYCFSITRIAIFLNLTYEKRCREVRRVINEIDNQKIILPCQNEEDLPIKERRYIRIFNSCQIAESKDFVELKLNPELVDILLDPELDSNYILSNMSVIVSLATTRSIRFYIYIKKFFWKKKGIVVKNDFEESYENLRELILLPHERHLYPKPANFKARVLDKIQTALEKDADLRFDFEPIRASTNGHPIVGYHFYIYENKNYKPLDVKLDPLSSRLTGMERIKDLYTKAIEKGFEQIIKNLREIGLAQDGVLEIVTSDISPAQVYNIIKLAEESSFLDNKAAFIRTKCRDIITQIKAEKQAQLEVNLSKEEATAQLLKTNQINEQKTRDIEEYIIKLDNNGLNHLVNEFNHSTPEIARKGFDINRCQKIGTIDFNKLKHYLINR